MAATLFVTNKTVETNITRIYDKLRVHSRIELARRLAELDTDQRSAAEPAQM